jgi:hypothetical protein
MPKERFRKNPRPNDDVLLLLETAIDAARQGHIQACSIVTSDRLHNVESSSAGEIEGTGKFLLIAGLSKEAHKLIDMPNDKKG